MRILILEDDPFIALDLQMILEGEGHEIVGVFDSINETYEHLEDDFEYALLDIDVVGGKSFGIAAELAERNIPFAFVSASQPNDLPQSLRKALFIPKPFEETSIIRSVTRASTREMGCN
ncbi:response regulator [Microvirga roseola]|uniref:response regulator n=1 Tax=Microvirga roseola TaxID=2883126 RepID=UPI001E45659E|nr:response regulator [Microvirga roseola]